MKRNVLYALCVFLMVLPACSPAFISTATVSPRPKLSIPSILILATATSMELPSSTPTEIPMATPTNTEIPFVELKLVRDGSNPETYLEVPYSYFTDGTVLKNELAQTVGFDQNKVKYVPFLQKQPFGADALMMPFIALDERPLVKEFYYKTTTPDGEKIWVVTERYLNGDGSIGFLHFAFVEGYSTGENRDWYLEEVLSQSTYMGLDYDLTNYKYSVEEYAKWQPKVVMDELNNGALRQAVDKLLADPNGVLPQELQRMLLPFEEDNWQQ